MDNEPIEFPHELIEDLRAAHRIVALTGAGISAESGIPTYASSYKKGGWMQYRPDDLATPEGFQRNPKLVWEWNEFRRAMVDQAKPNPAHLALVEIERHAQEFTLVTQNTDGFHQRAGSRRVIELYGNLHRYRCSAEGISIASWEETSQIPPTCPRCGAYIRPDVVWFGEPVPPAALQTALEASSSCDLFFSIGTSGLVEPAASMPYVALRHGAKVVEINTEFTTLAGYATYYLAGQAGKLLPALVRAAWPDT